MNEKQTLQAPISKNIYLACAPLGLALTVKRFSVVWSDLPGHALVVLPHDGHSQAAFHFQLDLGEMGEAKERYRTITDDL